MSVRVRASLGIGLGCRVHFRARVSVRVHVAHIIGLVHHIGNIPPI